MEYILKIGGSVITDKTSRETLASDIELILDTLSQNPNGIIIHGAGSFGHPHAKEYGIQKGSKQGVLKTHRSITELNRKVVNSLKERGVKAYPVHTSSMAYRNNGTTMMKEQIKTMLDEGFTPVLHGDVIATKKKGFTGISGDRILTGLEKEFDTGHAGFCTSEKGVLDSENNLVDELNSIEDFHNKEVEGEDVTGGMKNKVKETIEKNIEAQIFSTDKLEAFLKGEKPGTTVRS